VGAAYAPGRVNLIGDHTDYAGGLVLPMAVDLGTTVEGEVGGDVVVLTSDVEEEGVAVPLDVADAAAVAPRWGRYVAGMVAELRPTRGLRGRVRTTLPVGAGLSSSAALEVALALALGFQGTPTELALACQRAEQAASGVPCGVMDQLAAAAGVAGHALLVDCATLTLTPVPVPVEAEIVVVDSGERRALATSAYADRRAAAEAAAREVGPLPLAGLDGVARLGDPVLRRRARHIVTEHARVRAFVDALGARDLGAAGRLMRESHESLRHDYEVSTARLDALVERLARTPGVHGARLTGAGFGGCAVALAERGAAVDGWRLQPSDGARRLT
jgi:galactokinase